MIEPSSVCRYMECVGLVFWSLCFVDVTGQVNVVSQGIQGISKVGFLPVCSCYLGRIAQGTGTGTLNFTAFQLLHNCESLEAPQAAHIPEGPT